MAKKIRSYGKPHVKWYTGVVGPRQNYPTAAITTVLARRLHQLTNLKTMRLSMLQKNANAVLSTLHTLSTKLLNVTTLTSTLQDTRTMLKHDHWCRQMDGANL